MNNNKKLLIDELDGETLDGRYVDLQVINCDLQTGAPKGNGCLSIVFSALDTTTNTSVAVKFFDPDHLSYHEEYRRACFTRESDILERLSGRKRCLQLVQPCKEMTLSVPSGNNTVSVRIPFFVIEWLGGDIRDYFINQGVYDAEIKLELFRECSLAVFALHRNQVFHRDLKYDNLMRSQAGASNGKVVAIDLGTAALLKSKPIIDLSKYPGRNVGAQAFAAVESLVGLAHIRATGIQQDIYALGCMLFDLFNRKLYVENIANERGYQLCLGACMTIVQRERALKKNENHVFSEFCRVLAQTKSQVTLPELLQPGSTIPKSISPLMSGLLKKMTAVDFRDRIRNSNQVLDRIDTAIRILKHEQGTAANRQRKAKMRAVRLATSTH